jgi:hypothetical protein
VRIDRHRFMDANTDNGHQEVSAMSSMSAAQGFALDTATRRSVPQRRPVHPLPPGRPALRLTRRGRVAVLLFFVALVFLALTLFGGQSAATGEAGVPVEMRTIMVGEGDTLWGIASEMAEPGEVREMIHYLQRLNALPDASLRRGQELAVPVR